MTVPKLVLNVNGSGIYVSTDNGESWVANNGGLVGTETVNQMITNGNFIYFTTSSDVWKADGTVSPLAWAKIGTKNVAPIPNNNLTQIAFIGNDLYLGTNGGGVVKNANQVGTWTLLPYPKTSTPFGLLTGGLAVDTKSVIAITEYNTKLLASFDNDTIGVKQYDPVANTWADFNTGLLVTGNRQNDLLLRNDNATFYPRFRYFYKDGTTIYAATKRNFKDFNHKGIYTYNGTNWSAFTAGLDNKGATPVLSFNKVGATMMAATQYSGIATLNGSDWSTTINDFNKVNIIYTDGTNTFFCTNVGVYKYDNGVVTPKSVGLPLQTSVGVNDMQFKNGTYYACTANGVFTSTTCKGSWTRFATNDTAKNVTSITFAGTDIFASVNRRICKLNGTNWDVVPATKNISVLTQVFAYSNASVNYLTAAGEWCDVPVGILTSTDGGTTWTEYFKTTGAYDTSAARSDGFYNGTDSRWFMTGYFRYNATTNTLMNGGRLTLAYTTDNGVTWYTRKPLSVKNNLRYILMRDYQGATYAFQGAQNDGNGNFECFRGLVNTTTFLEDAVTVGYNTGQGGAMSMNEFGENLLFYNREGGSTDNIVKSENNGTNWSLFQTGLVTTSLGKGSYSFTLGNLMAYKSPANTIQVYDLFTAPVWTATYPNVISIAQTTANVLVKNTRPGTAYYVVLPDAATAPTIAQVIAGTDAADVAATIKGNLVVAKDVEGALAITGLTAATNYKVYTVIKSEVLKTTSLQTLAVTTQTTALNEVKLANSIFPVPAKNQLNVSMAADATVSMLNVVGARILSRNAKAGETLKIDVSTMKPGVYFIELNNGFNKNIEKVTIK